VDNNVLVGIEGFEDAGVYKISEDIAIVQTIDFFTPIVNDPYWFGQIAAANAMSDIYAMGAIPKTALNMVCFSLKQFDISVLKEILRGGIDKVRESGASLLGGHSVDDVETKYGLSVTGIVHPDKIIKNEGALPGDHLILTKPLGTGILNTGIKGNALDEESIKNLINVMAALNKKASEAMLCVRTHAATDVTGFGLAGHLKEMIKEYIGVELLADKIPCFKEAAELSRSGFVPGGLYRNMDYYKGHVTGKSEGFLYDIIFDPQTSGGLLMAIHPDDIQKFEETALKIQLDYWIIGRFTDDSKGKIMLI
jgi:selenide,water dikinase